MISSRTGEGDLFHCLTCGTRGLIEPSHPTGDAPCPACGQLLWPLTMLSTSGSSRVIPDHVEGLLLTKRRQPMLGLRATALRSVRRLFQATRRLVSLRTKIDTYEVYDHWLDG